MHAVLCYAVLCCSMLYYACFTVWFTTLRCTVSCYDMHAVLCCALNKCACVQTTAAGGVSWEAVEEKAASAAPKAKKVKKQMTVKVPKWCGKWVVSMDEFKEGIVGAKSKNIAGLCHQ